LREKLALAVSQANSCDYCLAAHTTIGGLVKIPSDEILSSRHGNSKDEKTQAALKFALDVLGSQGHVSDSALADVRAAGFSDGEIGEIVAHVALNVFTNYFNSVAQTDIDFPVAPSL
jgi:AhpD family alkylhydroperoxidase